MDNSVETTNTTIDIPPNGAPEYPFLSPPQSPDEIGRLGDYRILKLLGEGGMGFVFRGEELTLKRFVALKVMRPEIAKKPNAADRFLREGRAAASLKSDHIITIYRADTANGVPYLAMEFLEGLPLDEWIKGQKKAVPLPHALRIVRDTLRGLAVAHEKGLIHRDIKPANMWIEKGTSRIKILDFGLTRSNAADMQLTQEGAVVGTPAFMAPEQASGKPVDPRADLFSVGTVMYVLLAGKNPFTRGNLMETLGAVGFDTQPPIASLRSDVPKEYSDFLDRLLAKKPEDRPANAKAALQELVGIEKGLQDGSKTVPTSVASQLVAMPIIESTPQVWGALTEEEGVKVRTGRNSEATRGYHPAPDDDDTPRKPPSKKLLLGGLFAFFALVLGGITIIITNKDGTKTKVEVPDGAKVEVKDGGKTVASVGGQKDEMTKKDTPKPNAVMDPDRAAAEWAIGHGGFVGLIGGLRVDDVKKLPAEPFKVHTVHAEHGTTDEDLDHFRSLSELHNFKLGGPITDAGIAKLAAFPNAPNFVELILLSPELSDAMLTALPKFPSLGNLSFNSPKITGRVFVALKDNKITTLNLHWCQIRDGDLTQIEQCPKLTRIGLGGTAITDAGLKVLGGYSRLTVLHLHDCPHLTDTGIAYLVGLKNLTYLDIDWNTADKGSPLTSAVFQSVGQLTELKDLLARVGRTNDADLTHLVGLQKLETLKINPVGLTDVGLETLAKLKSLKDLGSLKGGKVTAEGVKKFRTALPGCIVETDFDTAADPDRAAAEFVLGKGGRVKIDGHEVRELAKLPAGPFKVAGAWAENPGAVTDADLELFRNLDALTEFAVRGAITDAGVAKVAGFPWAAKVASLAVASDLLTDAAFESIPKFAALNLLAIDSSRKVTGKGFAHLAGMPIAHFGPTRCGITDDALGVLKQWPKLSYLDVTGAPITDAGLKAIGEQSGLTYLVLTDVTTTSDAGAKHLEGLTALHTVQLQGASFGDAAMASFAKLPKLGWLGASRTKVTDAGVKALAAAAGVHTLHLSGTGVTDECLKVLAGVRQLKELDVCATKVTAEGVKKFLAARPDVTVETNFDGDRDRKAAEWVVSVGGWVSVNGEKAGINALANLPKEPFTLTALDLTPVKSYSDADLTRFKECKNITYLILPTMVTDAGLANFRDCKNLTTLDLAESKVTDAGLANFRDCKNLTTLSLRYDYLVTDVGLANFRDCKKLTSLNLSGTQVTDAGLAIFKDCQDLTDLGLYSSPQITDGCLATVVTYKHLENLHLGANKLTDAGLAQLKVLKKLKSLGLGEQYFLTDAGLAHVKELPALKRLNLGVTNVTDAGLAHLKGNKSITHLSIGKCPKVTDAGLAHLTEMTALSELNLSETGVTDAGLDHLAVRKTLTALSVQKTKVTAAGVKKFRAALPGCKITSDFDVAAEPDR